MKRTPEAVGKLLKQRRMTLGLSVKDASNAADMSDTTWTNIEAGRKVSDRNWARAGMGVQWQPDALDVLTKGDTPVEVAPASSDPVIDLLTQMDARLQRLEERLSGPGGR